MIKHTPQEIADFFGCYVAQDKDRTWHLFECKPFSKYDAWWEDEGFCGIPIEEVVDVPAGHDWTHLYEPHPDNESEPCYADKADSDNKKKPMRKEYMIAYCETPADLSQEVTRLMGKGWKPFEAPFATAYGPEFWIHQAMVRGV